MFDLRVSPAAYYGCLLLLLAEGVSASASVDKSGDSLINPTPAAHLRDLITDRPDFTESPFTVDAGHVQLETDFASATRNHLDGAHTREVSVGSFNVRVGLLPNAEAGVFISPYTRRHQSSSTNPSVAYSGFGDITLRGKLNFFGNDGGDQALGLIVDLKLPTAARQLGNDSVEGDVRLPIDFHPGGGWDLATMTELDILKSGTGSGRDFAWVNSLSLGRAIAGALGGYLELTSSVGPGTPALTFDVGLTWGLDANTQLDAGVNLGLTRAADDAVFFAGMSRRF